MNGDDKIKLFVCNHTDPKKRGCVSVSIDGHRFDLTIDETVILSEYLERAILFEIHAMHLREKTKDARDKADTGEILRALTETGKGGE